MSRSVEFRAGEVDELADEGREILRHREGEIVDSTLDGRFWFAALFVNARDILRRRRVFQERRRFRT